MTSLNGTLSATPSRMCTVKIGSHISHQFQVQTDVFVINRLTGDLSYVPFVTVNTAKLPNLPLADTFEAIFQQLQQIWEFEEAPKTTRLSVKSCLFGRLILLS
uniref:Uncharacterized protein n=1 Tax=Glossina austeni TaxID=7395 RepID=A0A1A9UDJ3_GLOAU